MTVDLYFSNHLDQLAHKLSDVMAMEIREKADGFDPPVVIVPNANLATWLTLFLAEKNGIFMHVSFRYLEEGLWHMLAALDPGDDPPTMLDNDHRRILLLYALQRLDGEDPALLPLTRYLAAPEGGKRPDHAARLWQLAERLAHLFKEYEFHRTDMIRSWIGEGAAAPPGGGTEMERCQRRLYLRVQALREILYRQTGKRLLSMMDYADERFARNEPDPSSGRPLPAVHLFGLSQISNFHLTLMGRLQSGFALHIYTMNPSREFWEDIRSPRERRWIRRQKVRSLTIGDPERDRGELAGPPDHPLLAAWGKPGRENIRLLCALTDYDFHAGFAAPNSGAGVLQRLQNDILTLSGDDPAPEPLPQDRSLQITACPGIYREVETVYNSILFNLRQDDTLQLTDVAILVPDMSAYKPVFDSVFNRNPRQLAYNLVDSNAEIESLYGKAVLSLLKLAAGRFTRKAVFDLILNPCFMRRWRLDLDTVQVWADWTRSLGIFHTYDQAAKARRGYPDSGQFTWKQGLQRLRLSRIMADPDVADPMGFVHYRDLVPYNDIHTGERERMEAFCTVVEALHRAAAALTAGSAGAEKWQQRLFSTCDDLFEIPDTLRGEAAVRQTLVRAFENLKRYDTLCGNHNDAPALDLDLIREFVRANLASISGGYGNYLTGGVTISALQPMRPIPFRIVYVLGMEEGNFPGKADPSVLDLRQTRRRIGDISLPERNCYLFLEMLLSVREKLYISFVSKDLQKDRIRQPCSVVQQLKRHVAQAILPPGETFRIAEIPLAGSSERYADPNAVNTWSDVLVNHFLADRVAYYRSHGLWETFTERAGAEALDRAAALDPDLSVPEAVSETPDRGDDTLTSTQLRYFLVDPVRYSVRRHLGLRDEAETIESIVMPEDEPFFSEFPTDYRLTMEPLKRWLDAVFSLNAGNTVSDPDRLFERMYAHYRRQGQTPDGAYARIDSEEIQASLRCFVETLTPLVARMRSSRQLFRAVNIGDPPGDTVCGETRLPILRFAPLSLNPAVPARQRDSSRGGISVHGSLPWVWQDSGKAWHALVLTGSGRRNKAPDKYLLEPVLVVLMCLAGRESRRWIEHAGITLHAAYRDVVREWTYRPDRETAETYLDQLATDVLTPAVAPWLPFETVVSRAIRPHEMAEGEAADADRRQFAEELKAAFADETDELVQMVNPEIPPNAFDRVRSRFRVYFQTL